MKYVSLDLETTGVFRDRPDQHNVKNVLQLSLVVEDTDNWRPLNELPAFTCLVKHDSLSGEPYAMAMNGWIIDHISGYANKTAKAGDPVCPYPILSEQDAVVSAKAFLKEHFPSGEQDVNVCGKNVGFDIKFLPAAITQRFRHRLLDAGCLWVQKNDRSVPGSADLAARAKITVGDHDAYNDNLFNISSVRRRWGIPLHSLDEQVETPMETVAGELFSALQQAFGGINPMLHHILAPVAEALAKYKGRLK